MGIVRNSFRAVRQPLFQIRYGAIRKYCTDSKVTHIAESKIQQEQLALAQKHGELWECDGRVPDEERGYIYHYKIKKEYLLIPHNKFTYATVFGDSRSEVQKKIYLKYDEIFPAIEPIPYEDPMLTELPKMIPYSLGYYFHWSGVFQLPDKEALESRLEQLCKERPDLKPLKILSSEDVADDLSFIEAYLKYDVLLSTGKEFVHDHFFHVISTIFMMLTYPQYFYERDRVREIVSKVLQQILKAEEVIEKENLNELKSQLPKIKTAVGSLVDLIWASWNVKALKEINYESFVQRFLAILDSRDNQQVTLKKFGEKVSTASLTKTWDQIVSLGWDGPGPAPKFCHRIT